MVKKRRGIYRLQEGRKVTVKEAEGTERSIEEMPVEKLLRELMKKR